LLQLCLDFTILDIRWPLLFFSETDFIYNDLHIVQKWTKTEHGKWKIFQDFCPRDIETCHLAAARCVKLRSLNSKLFFKGPHQLSKLIGPLKRYLTENIWIQRSNCIILGLTDTVALSANKARFFRFRVFFGTCSLQNEVGDPHFFFAFLAIIYHYLFSCKLKNICAWEIFGRERPQYSCQLLKKLQTRILTYPIITLFGFPEMSQANSLPICIHFKSSGNSKFEFIYLGRELELDFVWFSTDNS